MSYLLDTNTVSELIEATAISHELIVATHNSGDFYRVRTVDPWTSP